VQDSKNERAFKFPFLSLLYIYSGKCTGCMYLCGYCINYSINAIRRIPTFPAFSVPVLLVSTGRITVKKAPYKVVILNYRFI
jgi:hypothetical protein